MPVNNKTKINLSLFRSQFQCLYICQVNKVSGNTQQNSHHFVSQNNHMCGQFKRKRHPNITLSSTPTFEIIHQSIEFFDLSYLLQCSKPTWSQFPFFLLQSIIFAESIHDMQPDVDIFPFTTITKIILLSRKKHAQSNRNSIIDIYNLQELRYE